MTEPAVSADAVTGHRDELRDLGELILFHRGEWTEADFEALPQGVRAELHDGRLILTPSPNSEHIRAAKRLERFLERFVEDDSLVLRELDVRMAGGRRYRAPDVMVLHEWRRGRPMDPANVILVGEVISPGGGDEYGEKMTAYAESGIEWYLIVQETPAGFTGEFYRLTDGAYQLVSRGEPAGRLDLPDPFNATIELRELS
ncbi:MAG TPA: Uma2 family endonuclease [Actinocatenispora sp.]